VACFIKPFTPPFSSAHTTTHPSLQPHICEHLAMGSSRSSENSTNESSVHPRCRNAARASPLAGRPVLKKYATPLDTASLMTPQQFSEEFIKSKPTSRYNASPEVYEVRRPGPKVSIPTSPTKTYSPRTPVPPSATDSTVSGHSTLNDNNDDVAATQW
jgi:hypothetical protein